MKANYTIQTGKMSFLIIKNLCFICTIEMLDIPKNFKIS